MSLNSQNNGDSLSANPESLQPDFENNVAEFEAAYLKLVAETDPAFELNSLRFNFNPFLTEAPAVTAEKFYPARKQELNQAVILEGPKVIYSSIFGDKVFLKRDIQVKGSIYAPNGVQVGPNCLVEGSIVSGSNLQIGDGSRIDGSIVGKEVFTSGKVLVGGIALSEGDFSVMGTFEAQGLVAVRNIFIQGSRNDYIILVAPTIFAKNGTIETELPLRLGRSSKEADVNMQRFYLTRATDGTFRLARANTSPQGGVRPVQGTLITNLSDAELEKLLAELAALER